ncbi:MAG TPA: hypothetical protein VFI42_08005, partial [Thermomicrobiaceae bacterium]|nr:hypothetical protein [Thermomicrobiaceae bacterium]
MSDFLFNLARRSAGIAADLRARPLPPQPSLLEAPPEGTPGELAAGLEAPPAPAALPHSAPAPTVQRAPLAAPPLPATPAAPSRRAPEAVRSPFSELSHGEATLPARWSPSVAARQPAPAAAPREITGDVPSHALPRVAPVRPSFAPQAEPEAVRASDSAPIEARGPIAPRGLGELSLAPQNIHLSAPLPAVPSPGTRPASRPAGVGPVENPLESRPPFASASGASPTGRAALEDARLLVSARASVPAVAERGPELEAPARGG